MADVQGSGAGAWQEGDRDGGGQAIKSEFQVHD